MLERSDLSGKDRILLRIHDDINEMQTGKSILTESEIYNLGEGWTPENDFEAIEYNKYLNIWKPLRFLNTDIQTIFLNAVIDISAVEKVLLYFVLKDPKEYSRFLTDDLQQQEQDEAVSLLLENTGFEYESVLHRMTFDSLSADIQEDLLALHSEAAYEPSYLRDEEHLSTILKDKESLNATEIDELTDIILDTINWEFEHEIVLNERFFVRNLTHGYFTGVPMNIFVERMAHNLKITSGNEKELIQKISKIDDIKTHFRQAVKDEISKGIFFSEYVSLCNSTDTATCYGTDTKLPHNELIDAWINEKDKNKRLLQEHINSGKLILKSRSKKIFSVETYEEIITGESMYHSDVDLPFVTEYKEQIEQMMFFGDLLYLVRNRNFVKCYQNVLAYHELIKKVSQIIEKDITFMSEKYLKDLDEDIDVLNEHINTISEKITDLLYVANDYRYYMNIYVDDMTIDTEKLKPKKHTGQDLYEREVSNNFGTGWKRL